MSTLTTTHLTVLVLLSTAALIISKTSKKRDGPPLPPGPPPLPIVGNVRGFNIDAPWVTYTKWAAAYGDLIYTRFFQQDIIVISSEKVAKDLLERRSHIYSDRPELPANDIIGMSFISVFLRYGPKWRFHRRLFHQVFKEDSSLSFRPMQLRKAHQFLRGMMESQSPEDYAACIRLHSSSIIMAAVYDYEASPRDDPFVTVIEKAIEITNTEARPQVSAVFSAFPILLRLPSWFPGMGIKKRGAVMQKYMSKWLDEPFQYVKERMSIGTTAPCMVSDALEKWQNEDGEVVKAIQETAATAFIAAAETTASTMSVFLLAMVLYPEVQERAQALIDSVVGTGRLPNFEDRPSMPYIDAILRETLRWHPVAPMGIAHSTYSEDVYEGYYIPKGATILPNVWAMARNEEKYPNADEFIPERFLTADGSLNDDTCNFAFGFGRRVCVGRHVADASLWSAMALMLAAFKVTKAKDEEGKDIDFEPEWFGGLATHPLPFPCSITPRLEGMDIERLNALIEASA
ncbi:cytochrome P450 [Leucogyrophana mollusca]|uniref:Cytochrome P450 n=1 Tax=Leucogyrophana mollusca TaxID=85980 RepID=A0ACB8BS24_9AGAM|nr:cytochrome P450 [Leucogyrophana mollusca]